MSDDARSSGDNDELNVHVEAFSLMAGIQDTAKDQAVGASMQDSSPMTMATEEPPVVIDAQENSGEVFDNLDEPRYCNKCGAKIPSNSIFCPRCGYKLEILPAYDSAENLGPVDSTETDGQSSPEKGKKKPLKTKDMLIALAMSAMVFIAVYSLLSCSGKPNLKNVYTKYCSPTYAELGSDGSYLSIDTNPYNLDEYTNIEAYSSRL